MNRIYQRLHTCFLLTVILVLLNMAVQTTYSQSKTIRKENNASAKQTRNMSVPFIGDNVREASQAIYLVRDKLAKSQFETETEYLANVEKTSRTVKFKDKTLSDLVFSFAPYEKYDSEKKEYTIYIGEIQALPGLMDYQRPERKGLLLNLLNENKTSENPARYVDIGGSNITIPMLPAEAKEAEPNLMIAIYGLPIGSLSKEMFSFYVNKVIVFNKKTGKIYKEVSGKNIKYSEYKAPKLKVVYQ